MAMFQTPDPIWIIFTKSLAMDPACTFSIVLKKPTCSLPITFQGSVVYDLCEVARMAKRTVTCKINLQKTYTWYMENGAVHMDRGARHLGLGAGQLDRGTGHLDHGAGHVD